MKKRRWRTWDSNPGRQDGRHRRILWAMAAPIIFIFVCWNNCSAVLKDITLILKSPCMNHLQLKFLQIFFFVKYIYWAPDTVTQIIYHLIIKRITHIKAFYTKLDYLLNLLMHPIGVIAALICTIYLFFVHELWGCRLWPNVSYGCTDLCANT